MSASRQEVTEKTQLDELHSIVGPQHARVTTDGERIGGRHARFVVEPGTVAEASAVLSLAHRSGWHVCPRGHGSKIEWGGALRDLDLIVSTARLTRVLEHAADDLIVRVEAGLSLDALQHAVAPSGQMLALNPPDQGGSIGGIIATNTSGYRRQRYGTARDLLIGITVVLADGTVAKSGGKVVKNVAGYDLAKLYTGSLGTLGLIVEAIFRLHPRAPAHRCVTLALKDSSDAGAVVHALRTALPPVVLDALEVRWTMKGGQLVMLFEGTEPGVLAQIHRTLNLISPYGEAKVVAPERENDLWRDFARRPWEGHSNIGTGHVVGLKIGLVPSALGAILHEAGELARQHDVTHELVGHAGVGVLFAGVQGRYPETLIAFIQDLRSTAIRLGGYLVVLHAPHDAAAAVDVWGPVGDALPLMRRIKDQFDPSGVMSPGRFVGGL